VKVGSNVGGPLTNCKGTAEAGGGRKRKENLGELKEKKHGGEEREKKTSLERETFEGGGGYFQFP